MTHTIFFTFFITRYSPEMLFYQITVRYIVIRIESILYSNFGLYLNFKKEIFIWESIWKTEFESTLDEVVSFQCYLGRFYCQFGSSNIFENILASFQFRDRII